MDLSSIIKLERHTQAIMQTSQEYAFIIKKLESLLDKNGKKEFDKYIEDVAQPRLNLIADRIGIPPINLLPTSKPTLISGNEVDLQ